MNRAVQKEPSGIRFMLGVLWAIIITAVILGAKAVQLLPEAPDNSTYDLRLALLSPRAEGSHKHVSLILIDEQSVQNYPAVSPVNRGLLASITRALNDAGARAIAFDFVFDRETVPDNTNAFVAAVKNAGDKVVLGVFDERIAGVTESQLDFQRRLLDRVGPVKTGHLILGRKPPGMGVGDQVVRYIVPRRDPSSPPSFAEQIADLAKSGRPPASHYIAWLARPDKGGIDIFPTFAIPPHEPGSSDDKILPPSWRKALKDRIVLVGGNFSDRDQHLTPLSVFSGAKMPGVAIHAQIVAQLLDGRAIYELPPYWEATLIFLIALSGFWLATRFRLRNHGFVVWAAGMVVLILSGALVFGVFKIIIPSASIFFAWLFGVTGGNYPGTLMRIFRLKAFAEGVN